MYGNVAISVKHMMLYQLWSHTNQSVESDVCLSHLSLSLQPIRACHFDICLSQDTEFFFFFNFEIYYISFPFHISYNNRT